MYPYWFDLVLIAPYRFFPHPYIGMLIGTSLLAAYSILMGELTSSLLFYLGRNHWFLLRKNMVTGHNLSVSALHSGNKEAYKALNKTAHEAFGKFFFFQGALGMASLWPAAVALDWMSTRFESVEIIATPFSRIHLGYPFIFIGIYILFRIFFSRMKNKISFFKKIECLKTELQEKAGVMQRMA